MQFEIPLSAFAVSGKTFYVEHRGQLLRWKHGEAEWFNTGLVDESKSKERNNGFMKQLRLAVSNEFRKSIYSEASEAHFPEEISHLLPDPVDLADQTWNFFVDAWAEHGYRIPSEWQELN